MGGIKHHMDKELALLDREVMPVTYIKLPVKGNFARIVPLGCLHDGHYASLKAGIGGFIDYILKTPDTFTFLMGDLIENVLPETAARHKGSMYEQDKRPSQQVEDTIARLTPLAEAGKIIGAVKGNHQERSEYEADYSPEKYIAERLKIRYFGMDALLHLQVGSQIYYLHAMHGTGSTGNPAAVLAKLLMQKKRFENADVYLRGHHHTRVAAVDYHFDIKTGKATKVFYVGTGAFIGYVGTYAHRKELKPTAPGAPKVKLYGGRHDVHVTL